MSYYDMRPCSTVGCPGCGEAVHVYYDCDRPAMDDYVNYCQCHVGREATYRDEVARLAVEAAIGGWR